MIDAPVAIIGGSLTGPAAALFLQRKGVPAHVYEAIPSTVSLAGGVIGLEHPALEALEQAGIPQDRYILVDTEQVLSVTLADGVIADSVTTRYPGRTTTWTHLHNALVDRLAPGTIHYGYRAEAVVPEGEWSRILFRGRPSVVAKHVVWADGRNSTGRALFDSRTLRYSGVVAHRGERPKCPPELAHAFVRVRAPGTSFNTFPVVGADDGIDVDWTLYLNETPALFAQHFGQRPDALTFALPRMITPDVRDFVDRAARKLLPAHEADIVESTQRRMAVPLVDIDPPTRMVWPMGDARMILLGDAVASVYSHTARGANNGIEQALDLATVLHQHIRWGADQDTALAAMERRQLKAVTCALKQGPILGARMGLGPLGHRINDLVA